MSEVRWFYKLDGSKRGPVSKDDILSLLSQAILTGDTEVWCDGMAAWTTARECEFFVEAGMTAAIVALGQRDAAWTTAGGRFGWGSKAAWIVLACSLLVMSGLSIQRLFRRGSTIAVGGTVSYQGRPVERGQVVFEPRAGDGQMRVASVRDGKFTLPKVEGLPAGGVYVMRVTGFRETGKRYDNSDPNKSGAIYEQYIPAKYNYKSTITCEATRHNLRKGITLELD
jgi:hypothetical protein